MAVWNTWSLGSLNPQLKRNRTSGIKSPHTSFLSLAEFPIIQGLSRNGVLFARKFSGKYTEILDDIDRKILFNKSFPAGEMLLKEPKRHKRIKNRRKKSVARGDLLRNNMLTLS